MSFLERRRPRRQSSAPNSAGEAPAVQDEPFWKTKTLKQMSEAEWESLCDNCGKCCVISLEDADTGELHLTDVSCKLFDSQACGCGDYLNRKKRVPDCVKLTPKNVPKLDWLPRTCAYRLVSEGKDLNWWHPLISGDVTTVHVAQVSVRGKTRGEGRLKIPGLMRRITKWPDPLTEPPMEIVRKTPPRQAKKKA